MASPVFFFSFLIIHFYTVISAEYKANGDNGWIVPKNDIKPTTGHPLTDFTYKKDSVLVVTQEEYDKCQTSHPQFFSNNGDTLYHLDRPGWFYFISGVNRYCPKGQKMFVKILGSPATPPQSPTARQPTVL